MALLPMRQKLTLDRDRIKVLLKWLGYVAFAIFSFVLFCYLTFPYDQLKALVEAELSVPGQRTITIGELGPAFPIGVSASDVRIELPPDPESRVLLMGDNAPQSDGNVAKPKAPRPTIVRLDEVTIRGVSADSIGFSVDAFEGSISGNYDTDRKDGWSLELEIEDVSIERLTKFAPSITVPFRGTLNVAITLNVPQHRLSNAEGTVELEVTHCVVGDGKSKLKVASNPMLAMGITLPRLNLGRITGGVKIEKGLGTFENTGAQSSDVEFQLEGSVNLREPVEYSSMEAYLKIKLSNELKRRDAKFQILEEGLAAGRRSDGFMGMRLIGPLKDLRSIPSALGPSGAGASPAPPPGFRPPS